MKHGIKAIMVRTSTWLVLGCAVLALCNLSCAVKTPENEQTAAAQKLVELQERIGDATTGLELRAIALEIQALKDEYPNDPIHTRGALLAGQCLYLCGQPQDLDLARDIVSGTLTGDDFLSPGEALSLHRLYARVLHALGETNACESEMATAARIATGMADGEEAVGKPVDPQPTLDDQLKGIYLLLETTRESVAFALKDGRIRDAALDWAGFAQTAVDFVDNNAGLNTSQKQSVLLRGVAAWRRGGDLLLDLKDSRTALTWFNSALAALDRYGYGAREFATIDFGLQFQVAVFGAAGHDAMLQDLNNLMLAYGQEDWLSSEVLRHVGGISDLDARMQVVASAVGIAQANGNASGDSWESLAGSHTSYLLSIGDCFEYEVFTQMLLQN